LAQVRGSVGQRPYLCVCGCARCGDAEGADPDRPCHPPWIHCATARMELLARPGISKNTRISGARCG